MTAFVDKHGPLNEYRYFQDFVEGRRGEILDAALAVFGEKGYEAGTMREIAARVGVSEPAIYRHYESKEAILADIVATAGDRISSHMGEAFDDIRAENIRESLGNLLEKRRKGAEVKRAVREAARAPRAEERAERRGECGGSSVMAAAKASGPAGVMHILFHTAPHNEHFLTLMRQHLSGPMVENVRQLIPRIDSAFGIERTAEEREARLRIFMSLFVGYFTTSLFFDAPPNDDAIVDALLTLMGWEGSPQT